jgi:hypothetical protein
MLIDAFAPKFELPAEAEKFVEYVRQFGKGTKLRDVPADAFDAAVAAALRDRFEGDAVMTAKLDDILGPETIEVETAMIESTEPAERDPYEGLPIAYRTLREQLDAIGSEPELDAFVVSLKELRRSGPGESKDAARRLLVEIEHGAAGPITEASIKGLSRSPAERAFFSEHPALEARNAQILSDGRFIVHTDAVKPDESLRRSFSRLVDDALDPDMPDREELVAGIADYLTNVVAGRGTEEVRRRFAKGVATFDAAGHELSIHDIGRLGEVADALARRVIRDKGK